MIEYSDQKILSDYLNKWISNKINLELDSLIKLKKIKEKDSNIRALAYQLYENNGVIKRENALQVVKNLNQDQRKILREIGVKFGRYHIFLHRLFKPSVVSLRILLWKNFNQKFIDMLPPTFGLNFVEDKNLSDKNFMLLCGFEKFERFFVRIDILERLFIHIVKSEDKEIKLVPEMLNLLGCNKENFLKLIKLMNYKSFEKNNEIYFKYVPKKNNFKNKSKNLKDNPFKILNQINFK